MQDLHPVAVDGARRDALAVDGIDGRRGEDAGEHRSQRAARAMHAKGVKRVVVAEKALHLEDHECAEKSGCKADEQGGHGRYKAGGRRNRHQSRDRAGDGAQRAIIFLRPWECTDWLLPFIFFA